MFSTSGWALVEMVSNGAILTPVTHREGEGALLEDEISRKSPYCAREAQTNLYIGAPFLSSILSFFRSPRRHDCRLIIVRVPHTRN